MPTIRVGVQANSTSPGQPIDIDAGRANVSLLTNASAEGVQYSTNAGSSWVTVAAGASASVGDVTATGFVVRRQNAGGYPLAIDVTFSPADVPITGSTADQAAFQALVSGAGIGAVNGRSPIMAVGGAGFSLASAQILAGSPTVTMVTGSNGQPGMRVQAGVGVAVELRFNAINDSITGGDAYLLMDGTFSKGNLSSVSLFTAESVNNFGGIYSTNSVGFAANPEGLSSEQGGVNTVWFRRVISGNSGGTPTYPGIVGTHKIQLNPRGGLALDVVIYGFGYAARKPKGRICVVFDDGYESAMLLGLNAFNSRGIPVTLSLITPQIGNSTYVKLEQLRSALQAGNAIVTHGPRADGGATNLFTANASVLSAMVSDMTTSRDELAALGLLISGAEKCYVWPEGKYQTPGGGGNNTALLDAALAAGFTTGRAVSTTVDTKLVNFDALSKYNKLCAPNIGHGWSGSTANEVTNIAAIVADIGQLSTQRADSHLMLHRVVRSDTADGSMLSTSIRYSDLETLAAAIKTGIDAGTLEAVTMPQIANATPWSKF